jgi:protein-tyrosine-phosphatase
LRKLARERRVELAHLDGRGILQKDGSVSSEMARTAAREFDVDLTPHRSQSLYSDPKTSGDVFLIVEPSHVDEVLAHYRPLKPQFIAVGLLDPQDKTPFVVDPDQTTPEIYGRVYSRLHRIGERLLDGIAANVRASRL